MVGPGPIEKTNVGEFILKNKIHPVGPESGYLSGSSTSIRCIEKKSETEGDYHFK